jgi:homoserine kinase
MAVSVRVPATSANLGPGFDAAALALQMYDDLSAEFTDGPGGVEIEGEGAGHLRRDTSHLVLRALSRTLASHSPDGRLADRRQPAVMLRCHNRIPHSRGLGSSAAAIVAGVRLGEALLGVDLGPDARLAIATSMEGHPDNVAACLLGGFTLAWIDDGRPHAVRLTPVADLVVTVFVPPGRVATRQARRLLPDQVPHADAATNAGRAALLVAALTDNLDLLHVATADLLHQAYRAQAMPESYQLMNRLRSAGWAAAISGAGPTVIVLHGRDVRPTAELPDTWTSTTLDVHRGEELIAHRE